jgi:3-methylcrotonyl-CoA carboxylase alpha subunit
MRTPEVSKNVRVETGVRQGDEVSVYYDPMISKLVVWGPQRQEALNQLVNSLEDFEITGPNTNIEFLKRLAVHPQFVAGHVDTGFIKVRE